MIDIAPGANALDPPGKTKEDDDGDVGSSSTSGNEGNPLVENF